MIFRAILLCFFYCNSFILDVRVDIKILIFWHIGGKSRASVDVDELLWRPKNKMFRQIQVVVSYLWRHLFKIQITNESLKFSNENFRDYFLPIIVGVCITSTFLLLWTMHTKCNSFINICVFWTHSRTPLCAIF